MWPECVADWVNLTSALALVNQAFVAFAIRSTSAFEVKVGLSMCPTVWDHTFNFANNNGTWTAGTRAPTSIHDNGAWRGYLNSGGAAPYNNDSLLGCKKSIPGGTTLTSIRVVHTQSAAGGGGFARMRLTLADGSTTDVAFNRATGDETKTIANLTVTAVEWQHEVADTPNAPYVTLIELCGLGSNPFGA